MKLIEQTQEPMLVRGFRWVAIIEAASYLLLILGMVGKYGFDQEIGVTVMGPIHGALVVLYVVGVFLVWPKVNWNIGQVILAILLSVLPLGTLYVERKMLPSSEAATATI